MKIFLIALFILLIVIPLLHRILQIILIIVSPRFFIGMGVRIFKRELEFENNIKIPVEQKHIKNSVGNYVFTKEGGIYIYPRLFWSGFYNIRTSFALRMYGIINKNKIRLTVKISLFTIVYTLVFLLILIAFTVWSIMTDKNYIVAIMAGLLFLGVLISFIRPLFAVEDNYDSMINSLKDIIKREEQVKVQV